MTEATIDSKDKHHKVKAYSVTVELEPGGGYLDPTTGANIAFLSTKDNIAIVNITGVGVEKAINEVKIGDTIGVGWVTSDLYAMIQFNHFEPPFEPNVIEVTIRGRV